MMQSLTSLVDTMSQLVVNDRSGLDSLIADMRDFTGMMAQHDDLLGNMLQISPIFFREAANLTGDGNAVNFNANNVPLVDSWMCAISGRAKQFGMIEYFKDCK
jgi:phospholipid/cholesterol/gamma-HCH transport system substrate-binding protein